MDLRYLLASMISVALLVCGAVVVFVLLKRIFNKAVVGALEAIDKDLLGVDLHIGRLNIDLCRGRISFYEAYLDNPEGYDGAHLLKLGQFVCDINMESLICNCGKQLSITKLALRDVDVLYEFKGVSSNVAAVLAHLDSDNDDKKQDPKVVTTKASAIVDSNTSEQQLLIQGPSSTDQSSKASSKGAENKPTTLGMVSIKGIGVTVAQQDLGGLGARLAVADIEFKDFSKENADGQALVMSKVISIVLLTLLKSIVETTLGNALVVQKAAREWCNPLGEKHRMCGDF